MLPLECHPVSLLFLAWPHLQTWPSHEEEKWGCGALWTLPLQDHPSKAAENRISKWNQIPWRNVSSVQKPKTTVSKDILCVAATCGPLKVVVSSAVDECGCHLPTGIMDYPVTHLLPHKYLFFHLDFQPDLTVKVCVIILRLVCVFLLRLLNTLSCTLFYLILFHYILQPSNVITPWKILRESSQDIAVACSHI